MDIEPENSSPDQEDHSVNPEIKKTQFLLTQLIILTILIIGLVLIVAGTLVCDLNYAPRCKR